MKNSSLHLRRFGGFAKELVHRTVEDDIGTMAASICFYALFAMFPLILCIVFVVSHIMPHTQVQTLITNAVDPYIPNLQDSTDFLQTSIGRLAKAGDQIGTVSLLSLFWSAAGAFTSIQQAMDSIWRVHKQRSFVARRLIAFGMIVVLIVILVGASVMAGLTPFLEKFLPFGSSLAHTLGFIRQIAGVLLPVGLFAMCFVFYRFFPAKKPSASSALVGSFVAAVLIEVARQLFVFYARHTVNNAIYGTLFIVILLVLWMYIATICMLFGAEVGSCMEQQRQSGEGVNDGS